MGDSPESEERANTRDRAFHLLCQCLSVSRKTPEALRAIIQDAHVPWEELVQIAAFHRVRPQLYARLQLLGPGPVPENVIGTLAPVAHTVAARNQFYAGELHRILRLLDDEGIQALAFKGPILGKLAYGDEGRRVSADIDVLIRPADLNAVEQGLQEAGYERMNPDSTALHRTIRYLFEKEHHYVRGDRTFNVDVHTRAVASPFLYRWDFETLYSRSRTIQLCGAPVRTMGIEDTIQLTCFHGAKDRWTRLKTVADLAWLLDRQPDLDVGVLVRRARQFRAESILYLGFFLTHHLLDAFLPSVIERRITRHPSVRRVGTSLKDRLPDQGEGAWGTLPERVSYPWQIHDSMRDRMRYASYAVVRKVLSVVL